MDPSGIRLGTPAETTRGKKEKDMVKIAERIDNVLKIGKFFKERCWGASDDSWDFVFYS